MTGISSLPRDIQKLVNAKGWEEDDLLDFLAAFVIQNSLEDDLLDFLQEEAEKLGNAEFDDPDEDDAERDD